MFHVLSSHSLCAPRPRPDHHRSCVRLPCGKCKAFVYHYKQTNSRGAEKSACFPVKIPRARQLKQHTVNEIKLQSREHVTVSEEKIVQDNENTAHVVRPPRTRSGNEQRKKKHRKENTKWTVHEATIYRVVKIVTTRRAPPSTFILSARCIKSRDDVKKEGRKKRREITSRGRAFDTIDSRTPRTYVNNIIFQCEKQGPERSCWKIFSLRRRAERRKRRKTSNQKYKKERKE